MNVRLVVSAGQLRGTLLYVGLGNHHPDLTVSICARVDTVCESLDAYYFKRSGDGVPDLP